jgi:hemolysin activation/secretion protein
MKHTRLTVAVGLALSLPPIAAWGQAYERVAPKTLPVTPPPPPATDTPQTSPLPTDDQVVLQALKGLVFVPGPEAVVKGGLPNAAGVSAPDVPLLNDPEFVAQMTPYIGGKLTMGDIVKIVQQVNAWYKDHDKPFVSVTVPPQNITAGSVQIVVMLYHVGAVKAEGNNYFSSDMLVQESGLEPGQELTLDGIQVGLDRLNGNPFRSVNTVFQPGKEPGSTDVVLKTEDQLPLRLYSSFDNAGTANLGRAEWGAGFNYGNLFGLDQQLSYQFTRSFSARFNAHSLSWTAPLPWGDRVVIFGSYEQERPAAGDVLDENGDSGQAGVRYVHPLPPFSVTQGVDVTHDIQVGFDYKTTNNDLEFGGVSVFKSAVEVDQFPVVYEATESDKYGQTKVSNQLVFSPGGLTKGNNDTAFHASDPHSGARYVYDRLGFIRTTGLPGQFSGITRVVAQVSDSNLQPSEEQGLGGMGTVRGYYTDTAIASKAILVSQEFRTPPVSLAKLLKQDLPFDDQFQVGVFDDWGHVCQVKDVPDAVNSATLASVGIAAHVTLGRYADLRVDTGWQLRTAPGASDRSVFTDIAVIFSF